MTGRNFDKLSIEERRKLMKLYEDLLAGNVMVDTPRCIVCNGDVIVTRNTTIEYKSINNPHLLLTDGTIGGGFELAICQGMCRGAGAIGSLNELEKFPDLAKGYKEGKIVFKIAGLITFVDGKPYRIQRLPQKLTEKQRKRMIKDVEELHSVPV